MTGIKQSHELKTLQGQRARLQLDLEQAKTATSAASASERKVREELGRVERRIERLTSNNEPVVSEHALLRYLERVKGVDLDAIRKEILTPQRILAIKSMGSLDIKMDGIRFVVRNGVVVTAEDRG